MLSCDRLKYMGTFSDGTVWETAVCPSPLSINSVNKNNLDKAVLLIKNSKLSCVGSAPSGPWRTLKNELMVVESSGCGARDGGLVVRNVAITPTCTVMYMNKTKQVNEDIIIAARRHEQCLATV